MHGVSSFRMPQTPFLVSRVRPDVPYPAFMVALLWLACVMSISANNLKKRGVGTALCKSRHKLVLLVLSVGTARRSGTAGLHFALGISPIG